MEETKQNRLRRFIAVIIFILLVVSSGLLVYKNYLLNNIVETQNNFLDEVKKSDSTYQTEQKILKDSLDKYTQKLSWVLNGATVNPNAFIDAYKKIENQKDSLELMYSLAKEYYGFDIKYTRSESPGKINRNAKVIENTEADSASQTYYFFKDRIYKKDGSWWADVTSKKHLQELADQNKILRDKIKELEKQLETLKQSN